MDSLLSNDSGINIRQWVPSNGFANKHVCTETKSKSHFDRQSVGQSWCQAPRTHDQLFFLLEIFFRQLGGGLLFCSALSDERTVLQFTVAVGSRQRSHAQSNLSTKMSTEAEEVVGTRYQETTGENIAD
jgi:hypothetical protein